VVHGNAQFPGLVDVEARLLELLKSESSALADLDVVSQAGAADRGAQERRRLRSKRRSTLCTGLTTALFACWLVEPGSHPALPILLSAPHKDKTCEDHREQGSITGSREAVVPFGNGCWGVAGSRLKS